MPKRPLPWLSIAFAAGILLAWWSLAAVGCLALGGAAILFVGMARRRNATLWGAALLLAAWLGAARYATDLATPPNEVSRLPSTSLTLTGTLADDPTLVDDLQTDEPASAKFVLDTATARLDFDPRTAAGATVAGRVAVRMPLRSRVTQAVLPEEELPLAGDVVEVRGRLERPDGPRNPGGFDYRALLARQGIHTTLTAAQPARLRILRRASAGNPLLGVAHGLRRAILRGCRQSVGAPDDGVLEGMLVGERHQIPQRVQDEFERTGTTHVLATAGLHVGMVVCLLTWALRHAGVGRRAAVAAAIGVLALYAVIAGERAAVLRAVIVASVYLVGELLEREPDLGNALAIAAGALLLFNPFELFDPGFQLSFATVITIVLLMPLFRRLPETLWPNRRGDTEVTRRLRFAGRGAAVVALLAAAAQIGAAPLVATYFYNVSLISVAANALVVPIVFLIIALGFPTVALAAIHPVLAASLAVPLRGLLGAMLWTIHHFAGASLASINVAPPSPLLVTCYYVAVWSAAWYLASAQPHPRVAREPARRRAMRRIAVAAAAIVVAAGCWDALRARPRELRVTFLDVGQGDGCVLESPGGKVLVVDAGGLLREGQDDEGRRVVAPYLRYRGINGIDAIVLTHPHADHIGGATTLIDRFPTRDLLDDGVDERAPLVTATLGEAAKTGARARICRRGETLDFGDGVTAEALGPPEDLAGAGANNASVVLMVRYGRTSFLLTGDAEAPEEEEIVAQGRDLSCDVLKVGHHGSRTSSTAMLLAAAHPRVAVISVGKRNIYNHPSPGVVDRLQQAGATVYRTDLNGAVICRSDGARVTVETMVR